MNWLNRSKHIFPHILGLLGLIVTFTHCYVFDIRSERSFFRSKKHRPNIVPA